MIVAHKVKDSVNHQEKDFWFRVSPHRPGLALGGLARDDHISENLGIDGGRISRRHGKNDDVGRTMAVEILAVQAGDLFIIDEDDADLMFLTCQGA